MLILFILAIFHLATPPKNFVNKDTSNSAKSRNKVRINGIAKKTTERKTQYRSRVTRGIATRLVKRKNSGIFPK